MMRAGWLATALVLGALAPSAWAAPDPKAAKAAKGAKRDEPKIEDAKEEPAAPPVDDGPVEPPPAPPEFRKQDLTGHDPGPGKHDSSFERDRFYVDKTDSESTAKGTLVQGSLTSTTFGYRETGGTLVAPTPPEGSPPIVVPSNSPFSRLFTELRLQTDLRHISAGKWDARIDVRGRVVNDPGDLTPGWIPVTNTTVQSGFRGNQELDIKELWLVRNGKRSDVFIGRQFLADLGVVRFDGVRVDYARSEKLTLLGFAGLYPIRGSRSITDDYKPLFSEPDPMTGARKSAGRFVGTGGFGAAYRTANTYGSFGGVVMAPFQGGEQPRVYATSTGYWRFGAKLDIYHLAIFDFVGTNKVNTGLTNLSLGLNWKPSQRLRGTLAFNRVDTETLSVQAQAFLQDPDRSFSVVQNEAYFQRIATNEARASLSAGLGELQRVELTAAFSYRYRGEVSLTPPAPMVAATKLPLAQSGEVYGSIVDRRSLLHLRLGLDGSQSFHLGDDAYHRTTSTAVRVFASHEIGNGRGEWELEAAYNHNEDDGTGKTCGGGNLLDCFGAAKSNVLSAGTNLFIRLGRNWFAMASVFVNHIAITHIEAGARAADPPVSTIDPPVTGLSGFLRISYRF